MFIIMDIVSKIIPLAVFLSIYKALAVNSLENVSSVWKVIAANYMLVPFCGAMLLWITLRRNTTPREFMHKISPVFMIAFLTKYSDGNRELVSKIHNYS